jgi:chromosomal replication initiation ATPase DnaA
MTLTADHIISWIERTYPYAIDPSDVYAHDRLKSLIASRMNVTVQEINSRTRKREVVYARHVYHTLCKYVLRMSLEKIGLSTSKDHATALHSIRVVHNLYQTDVPFRRFVNRFLGDMGWEYVKDKLLEPINIRK